MSPKMKKDYKVMAGQMNVRLDPDIKTAFIKKCIKAEVKPASVVRQLISDFLEDKPLNCGESMLHCSREEKEPATETTIGGKKNERSEAPVGSQPEGEAVQ